MNLAPSSPDSTSQTKVSATSELEKALSDILEQHLAKEDGKTPSNLAESIRYSLLAPGKRIRPRMMLACGEMLQIPRQTLLPAALALEMIHCFTLIHDDLPCMDDDDFRRGMPSNHKKFGESIALLAGDGLMALAVDAFMDCPVAPARLVAGLKRLTWAMGPRGVIGGQAAESLLGDHSHLNDLYEMHHMKTGALFSAAILVPKEFAGISDESPEGKSIFSFAKALGLAFQIADDLEDAVPSSQGAQPQDNSESDPKCILFYTTWQEAGTSMLKRLDEVSHHLETVWGPRAEPLLAVSREISRKIESALRPFSQ